MSVASVIKHNRRLDGRLVPDALERLAVLLELEHLVDDAPRLDLARVEVVDGLGCRLLTAALTLVYHCGQQQFRSKGEET